MNLGQTRVRLVEAGAALIAVVLIAGCGSTYRTVITPITSTGPAAQPSSLVAVISSPSPTSNGIATIIDYSGDTVMASQAIGVGPVSFTVDASGFTGYTVNRDGTMTNFPVSATLQEKSVGFFTLPTGAQPIGLFSPKSGLWAADLTGNSVDIFTGSPEAFQLSVPVAATPVMVIGAGAIGQRNFAISQGSVSSGVACNNPSNFASVPQGVVTPIEVISSTADAPILVGKCPVYAVTDSVYKRLFVLNRGSDTISVIDTQNNVLDSCTPFINSSGQTVTCHPTLPLSTNAVTATGITPSNGTSGMTATAGPVYAEYNAVTQQLVVANYDGGTISIIDVSLDGYGNDSSTFGTTFTVPVGNNPASVTVLNDGSRAYTANQADGTVSIVNLSSHTVEKTALSVVGHPRTVVSTQNSGYAKVYVASPDSNYLTIISSTPTTTDLVNTTVLVQGNIVDVRVSTQDATSSSGNSNAVSRQPGYGQPCNLPPALMVSTYRANYTVENCSTMP